MNPASAPGLANWTPIRLFWLNGEPCVDWCRLPPEPLADPFFEQTVGEALRHPARLLFRRVTSVDVLTEFDRDRPGLPPAGFIFHMSRCGSTLLAQMLAALPDSIVVSEAPPIDQVLRAGERKPNLGRERQRAWFRGMLNALGQRRSGDETRCFIKFDCWHALELAFIREAFPEVPWVFLYRDPVEVLVSHSRRCGAQMIPGVLDPRRLAIDPPALATMSGEEYGARVLAQICRTAVLAHGTPGRGRLVNFNELPAAGWESIAGFFGLKLTEADLARMQTVSRRNAKKPTEPYVDDRQDKQRGASDEMRRLAEEWVGDVYAELEAARAASANGGSHGPALGTQSSTQ